MEQVRHVAVNTEECLSHPKLGSRTIRQLALFVAQIIKAYLSIYVNSARLSVRLGPLASRWTAMLNLKKNMII